MIAFKRYWSRSEVDGERFGKMGLTMFGPRNNRRSVSFFVQSKKHRAANEGKPWRGQRYVVRNVFFQCVCQTDDFREALRAFIRVAHDAKK